MNRLRLRAVQQCWAAIAFCLAGCFAADALAQGSPGDSVGITPRRAAGAPLIRPQFEHYNSGKEVKEIKIIGNKTVREARVRSYLQSRVGRPLDPQVLEADVHRLSQSGLFQDVKTFTRDLPDGVSITFEVFERSTIRYIKVVGNTIYSDEYLGQKSGLKIGQALNVYGTDAAAEKIREHYEKKGYRDARVSVLEGNKLGDEGVVFVVHEGTKQRIWNVEFEGNEIVSDGRLETQIQSRPGYFKYLFRGAVNRQLIDEDVQKLTAYYRQLGYFHARIGREIVMDDGEDWATLTFVIDEGPRYKVREVLFLGNEKFNEEVLRKDLQLRDGEQYHMAKMNADLRALRDLYGAEGYIFADIQAEPRFFEEPGELDLVYNIREGDQYRVGEIRVHIAGNNPHTQRTVVLNRLGFAPGDILDSRKIRDSERRLKYSQLFRNDAQRGVSPRIVVRPPGTSENEDPGLVAETPTTGPRRSAVGSEYRGQSPDTQPAWKKMDVDIFVEAETGDAPLEQQSQTPLHEPVYRLPPIESPVAAPPGSPSVSTFGPASPQPIYAEAPSRPW